MPPKAASKQRSVTSSIPSSPVSHEAKQELPSLHPKFCDPKADLILESCDGQRFAVHKYWLQAASPVFSKMLEGDLTPSTIPLDETSEEVANLLELITTPHQGVGSINIESFAAASEFASIIDKYEVWRAEWAVTQLMKQHIANEPLPAFIWACKHRQLMVARAALSHFEDALMLGTDLVDVRPWFMETSVAAEFDVEAFCSYTKACLANLLKPVNQLYSGTYMAPLQISSWKKVSEDFEFS